MTSLDRALRNDHGEAPVWRGLAGDALMVLYQAAGGSWTLVVASPGGPACILGHGVAGTRLAPVPGEAA